MKTFLIVLLVILVLAVIAFLRFSSPEDKQSDSDKIIVEKYIRDNIKTIVSEQPVLGGSWYVTLVDINPLTKTGTVEYEDGHIQGNKSFNYVRNNNEVKINLIDSPRS